MVQEIIQALETVADDVRGHGVLFENRERLLTDLGPWAPLRKESGALPVYEAPYFRGLVGHPSLNPVIIECLEEALGRERWQRLSTQVVTWRSEGLPNQSHGPSLYGPVGCSALFFSIERDRTMLLLGRRSGACAVSAGAWTTTLDEGIASFYGWYHGLLKRAVVQELGLQKDGAEDVLEDTSLLGWMAPLLPGPNGADRISVKGDVVQSGANAVFGVRVSPGVIDQLAERFNGSGLGSERYSEFSEYAVWDSADVFTSMETFSEVVVSATDLVERHVSTKEGRP